MSDTDSQQSSEGKDEHGKAVEEPDNMLAVVELQWKAYVDQLKQSGSLHSAMAVCDVSGSMSGIPMEVSCASSCLTHIFHVWQISGGGFTCSCLTADVLCCLHANGGGLHLQLSDIVVCRRLGMRERNANVNSGPRVSQLLAYCFFNHRLPAACVWHAKGVEGPGCLETRTYCAA